MNICATRSVAVNELQIEAVGDGEMDGVLPPVGAVLEKGARRAIFEALAVPTAFTP